jgi:hypothetical protein
MKEGQKVEACGMHRIKQILWVLVGKHEGKTAFGRTKCRWEDSVKMDCKETGWQDVDWTHLAQEMDTQ